MLFHPPKSDSHVSYTISQRVKSNGEPVKAQVLDLGSIMRRFHHSHIDVLKMDVEGAEYAIIESLARQGRPPAQLMVEFHHAMYGYAAKDTRRALKTLRRDGYYPYYVSDTWREFGFLHAATSGSLQMKSDRPA